MRGRMSLLTLLGTVMLGLLLAYPPHIPGQAAGHTQTLLDRQTDPLASFNSTASNPSNVKQWMIVDRVTYLLTQDGIVKALWLRHGFYYQLWLHYVPPSSMLMRVANHVLYFAAPDGTLIALRTSDGYVLWIRKRI